MKKVIVLSRQTWFDLAIQETGSVYNAGDISKANNSNLTDDPQPGTWIIVPDGLEISTRIVLELKTKKIVPATAIVDRAQKSILTDYEFPTYF